jgi:ubiquinone/menaquinone biosynthesis C-methylase UbiE
MWDRWVQNKKIYTIPLSREAFKKAKESELTVYLTIGKPVPREWFKKAKGKKLLGLACGGGQQGPIFAAHGYEVTIMDYSAKQLENDRMVAEREHLTLNTVQADMTKPFPFEDESFDIVFCPVSNVFIEDLTMMWTECYRVLKRNGLLMVGYMNPWLYMFDADDVWNDENIPLIPKYSIPFNSRMLEQEGRIQISPEHGYEFSHTLEEQIGGQLKAGFAMIDFYESNDARNRLSQYGNLYLANLSIKL